MFRTKDMSWLQLWNGWQGATNVQDEGYVVVAGIETMARNDECSG
ncbi:hypothetical protein [Colwellia sp. PAMC 20917]|nr:hypothetical protein [Colwellia sp. PAMC 20917]